MAEANRSVLAQLVAPHSVDAFLANHWPDKWFAAHGDVARLPAFLRLPEFSSIEALTGKYRGSILFTAGRKTQYMQTAEHSHALSLYRMGLTIKFNDLGPSIAPIAPALRQLETELGVNPNASVAAVFASPVSEGLPVHFDGQDIFSIQLRGSKRFHVAPVTELPFPNGTQFAPGAPAPDDIYPQISGGYPDPDRAQFATVEMKPGSVLFMPRGTWHYTESDGDSMSVSIGMHIPSAMQNVLQQLRLLLLQKPEWRRPLFGAWGGDGAREAAAAHAAKLLAELPDIARQLKVENLLTNILPVDRRLEMIKPKTRFQKASGSRIAVETAKNGSTPNEVLSIIVLDPTQGDQITARMELPRTVAAVFRWIGDQRAAFVASELSSRFPQLPFAEHQKILQAAVGSGLAKILWFQAVADESA